MNAELSKMLQYDFWANREYLTILESNESVPTECLDVMAHIAAVQKLFLARVGHGNTGDVWPDPDLISIETELNRAEEIWNSILAGNSSELDKSVSYVNSKGESWSSNVSDIVVHLTMHGSYLRGQMARMLGRAGIEPPYTDYIHATRNGIIPVD